MVARSVSKRPAETTATRRHPECVSLLELREFAPTFVIAFSCFCRADLGPPQLSARFVRDERGPRDRGYGGDRNGGYRGGYDRDQRDPRDVRGDRGGYGGGYMGGHRGEDPRYPPAYQRGPPGGGYGDRGPPMYRDEGRYHPEPRFDPYPRGRDGPPPQRYDDRGPPRGAYYDGPRGGPHGGPGPVGGPMGGPGPMRNGGGRRSRSPPPRGGDDGRGPAPVNGGAPPVALLTATEEARLVVATAAGRATTPLDRMAQVALPEAVRDTE